MNPETKLLLEEMQKQFADQKARIDQSFAEHDLKWEQRLLEAFHEHQIVD